MTCLNPRCERTPDTERSRITGFCGPCGDTLPEFKALRCESCPKHAQGERRAHRKELARKWYAANREKRLEYARKYRIDNLEKRKEYDRQHYAKRYAANPEKERERKRKYDAANPEKKKESARKYYAEHRDQSCARTSAWSKAHPEKRRTNRGIYGRSESGKRVHRLHRKRRDALKRQQRHVDPKSILTRAQWDKIVVLSRGRCHWCKRKMDEITQDHVIPLSKGGTHTAENIAASCRPCNARKGAKIVTLF